MLNVSIVLAEACDRLYKSTHSLNSIKTQNRSSEADIVTAGMTPNWLSSSLVWLVLAAAAAAPDSERRSGRHANPHHFHALLADRSYSCD